MVAVLVAVDSLAVTAGLLLAYWLRFSASWLTGLEARSPTVEPWIVLPLGAAFLAAMAMAGLYQRRNTVSGLGEYKLIATASTITVLVVIVLAYLHTQPYISRGFLFASLALVALLVASARFCVRRVLYAAASRGWYLNRVLIVGTDRQAVTVAHELTDSRSASSEVLGFLSDFVPVGTAVGGKWRVLGEPLQLDQVASDLTVNHALVVHSGLSWESLRGLVQQMHRRSSFEISLIPSLYDLHSTSIEPRHLGPVLALAPRPGRIDGMEAVLKRALDIAVTGIALIVAVPLMAITALASRLASAGWGLHRDQFVGPTGTYGLVRFADPGWVGRAHLSRLPELFSVITGRISLVGPRPVPVDSREAYSDAMPLLEAAKPGFIGPWWLACVGRPSVLADELRYDLYYLRNYSIWLDLEILVKAARAVLRPGPVELIGTFAGAPSDKPA